MAKLYYYIDYGSGYTNVIPYDNKTVIGWRREINPIIRRKFMSGNFTLLGSQAQAAYTYFITNINFEADIRVYENGVLGVGTLIYQGWIQLSGEYHNTYDTFTFSKFKTNDEYTALIDVFKNTHTGETIYGESIGKFTIQGVNSNANKIKAFSVSGGSFSSVGTNYTLDMVGRPCSCTMNNKIILFDDHQQILRSFNWSGSSYTPSTTGTELDIGALISAPLGASAMCYYDNSNIVLILSGANLIRKYTATTGTWSLGTSVDLYDVKYPSICNVGSSEFALVDDLTKQLQRLSGTFGRQGSAYDLGDVKRPKVCTIDTDTVAIIDENTRQIQAYTYASSKWDKVGTALQIPYMIDPSINQHDTNEVVIHDTYTGKLYFYSFSGTAWTLSGSGTTLSGGINSTICSDTTHIHVLISDSLNVTSRLTVSIDGIISTILDLESLTADYGFDKATCEANFPIAYTFIGSMESLYDHNTKPEVSLENNYEYTLEKTLQAAEIFQNYWYLEYSGGKYYIKFTRPASFSSFGSDIDVSAYSKYLNQRGYLDEFFIKREKITFVNSKNSDYLADWIEYDSKNSDVELVTDYSYFNDFEFVVDYFTGRTNSDLNKSGAFLVYIDEDDYYFYCPAGTSPLGNTNIRNQAFCTTRVMQNYMQDYRYLDKGNFTLNGNSINVQYTCREMIYFPDVVFTQTNFPTDVGNLDWGSYKSYITEISMDCNTFQITAKSILLDKVT